MNWMLLVVGYAILSGFAHIFQKKSYDSNSTSEIFLGYMIIGFIIVFLGVDTSLYVGSVELFLILLKSIVFFVATLFAFIAMKKLAISTYGVVNMSRVLFSTLIGLLLFNEVLRRNQLLGLIIITAGLLMINQKNGKVKYGKPTKPTILLLISCFCNSISAVFDKIIMITVDPIPFQFWFMLFLLLLTIAYVLYKHKKINLKRTFSNPNIYLLAFFTVMADRYLFRANSIYHSQISIMTLLKQISIIITVLIGGKIFKEKNLVYKLLCSLIILIGVVLIVLW